MFSQFKNKTPATLESFPSVARLAAEGNLTFAEATEKMRANGSISGDDPRMHLDPMRIQQLSHRKMSDLMRDYQKVASGQKDAGPDSQTRARYAAVVKAGSDQLSILDHEAHRKPDVAMRAEFLAYRMAKSDPRNPAAREMMTLAAAASDSQARERATRGFEGGNISKAAKTQGRSWIEVRDDLARFGALSDKDPRRKIRQADIQNQAGGMIKRSNTLPPDQLEDVAMRRLKTNPKDELATAWLATAGSISSENAPGKVKGAEVQGVLPAKGKLFGKYAAKRRAVDLDLS
jgi:hypothetical protein